MVVTDARPLGEVSSAWENPFFAGEPPYVRGIVYFDPPQPAEPATTPDPGEVPSS